MAVFTAIEVPPGNVEKDANASLSTSTGSNLSEGAFDAFYRQVSSGLWSYIHRVTRNAALADDLFQKTFYQLLKRGDQMPADETHLRRYVYRIATNLITDHWRQMKREAREEVSESLADSRPHQASFAARHDMMRLFGLLKPQERALLWLAHVEGSTHVEIAEALEVGAKSVRVLLFRARTRLAALLEENGLGPEVMS